MFSGVLIGALVAASVSTWVYTHTMRRTGGNNKSSLITGGLAGLASFVIIITVVATIDQMLAK